MRHKKGYFQGGGGVNQPGYKYPVDKSIVVQPRFKEPFYRNYDLYQTEGQHSPGSGYHGMQHYKSIQEFLEAKRKRMKNKYVADDSWIEQSHGQKKITKSKMRMRQLIKIAQDNNDGRNYDYGKGLYENMDKYHSVKDFIDSNEIDFPLDNQGLDWLEDDSSPLGRITGLGPITPSNDFEGKSPEQLNFGEDYTEDEHALHLNHRDLEELMNKYLSPEESPLLGMPDGIEPTSDLDAEETVNNQNPFYGTTDLGTNIYEDKWNI